MQASALSGSMWLNDRIRKIYTFIVALLPFFASYATGIPGICVADMLLILFAVISIAFVNSKSKNVYTVRVWPLPCILLLIAVLTFFSFLNNTENRTEIITRMVRYFFYVFCALYVSKHLLNVKLLLKCVRIISLIMTGYLVLQYVCYYGFGIILRGYIPGLPLYVDYDALDYAALYEQMYRPTSFFLEPAHYARYAAFGLAIVLNEDNTISRKRLWQAVFISVGLLLSTSSQGYVLLAFVWALSVWRMLRKRGNATWKILFFLAAVLFMPVLIYVILKLPMVQSTLTRSLNSVDVNSLGDSAIGARLGGLFDFLKLNTVEKLFGTGFGNIPDTNWLSSLFYWLYGSGLIVTLLMVTWMIYVAIKLKNEKRIIMLSFMLLFISDDCFYNYLCVMILSMVLLRERLHRQTPMAVARADVSVQNDMGDQRV